MLRMKIARMSQYTQNMKIERLPQYTHCSTESYLVDNKIISNVVQFRNGNLIQPTAFHQHNRKFSRSTSLLHEIRCVTNSYYEDLGLESTATAKQIKDAFYRQETHSAHGTFSGPINI